MLFLNGFVKDNFAGPGGGCRQRGIDSGYC